MCFKHHASSLCHCLVIALILNSSLPTLLVHRSTVHAHAHSIMVTICIYSPHITYNCYSQAPGRWNKQKPSVPDIITDVPLDEDEVMEEVTVTCRKKRIVISSKLVNIPLPPKKKQDQVGTLPSSFPHRDTDVYSDIEDANETPGMNHCTRKGQSRSVLVRFPSSSNYLSEVHKHLDNDRGLAS